MSLRSAVHSYIGSMEPAAEQSNYNSALALGYAPNSWTGMWKLRQNMPIIWISKNWAITAEVVEGANHVGVRNWRNKIKIRYRLKKRR